MPPRARKQAAPKVPEPAEEPKAEARVYTQEDALAMKQELEKLREELRIQTLIESDRRGWCVEGTRSVLAKMRLKTPGKERKHFRVKVPVTLMVTRNIDAWIPESAVSSLMAAETDISERLLRVSRDYGLSITEVKFNESGAIVEDR